MEIGLGPAHQGYGLLRRENVGILRGLRKKQGDSQFAPEQQSNKSAVSLDEFMQGADKLLEKRVQLKEVQED